jgi:hypothetical protein
VAGSSFSTFAFSASSPSSSSCGDAEAFVIWGGGVAVTADDPQLIVRIVKSP